MRNFKKFLTTAVAAVTLAAMLCFGASAAKFSDVNASDKVLSDAVNLLSQLNITKGTSETTFGTNENVTRQQMAAFIYRLMKKGASMEGGENHTTFTDLKDSTYFAYVSWANSMNIIKGRSETVFDPTGTITLQEAYTMMVRAMGYDTGDLIYPHGYIDIAESSDVALDKGLPSAFSYETPLSRGAVAIILYNAFFGETAHEETEYVETFLSTGKGVMQKKTYNPTIAEYIYDVNEGSYTVRATPKYAFNEDKNSTEYYPLIDEFDGNMMQFVAVDQNEEIASFYYDFDKLGLAGNVDDYIMGVFDIFYTVDKDGEMDTIYYAENNMDHQTSEKAEVKRMSANASHHYYEYWYGASGKQHALLLPKLTINSKEIYFFDAPYSYAKPDYANETDEAEQKRLRDEKCAKFINIKSVDEEKGTYSYYVELDFVGNGTKNYVYLLDHIHQVTTGGFYKFDIYDVDGDGLYDYVRYRPYTFGKMDGDEGYTFTDIDEYYDNAPMYVANDDAHTYAIKNIPMIYYNGANLSGKKFNDGDFAIVYLNPEANELDVFDVLQKAQGPVSSNSKSTMTVKINGTSYRTGYQYLTVKSYRGAASGDIDKDTGENGGYSLRSSSANGNYMTHLHSTESLGNEYLVYTYNKNYNNIYFYEPIDGGNAVYDSENIMIPLGAEDNNGGYIEGEFDVDTGITTFLLRAWINGAIKYVPVSIEDMYPTPTRYGTTYNFGVTAQEEYQADAVYAYLGKICTYTVDKNGVYTITSLLHSRDEDGEYNGINKDSTVLAEDKSTEMFGEDIDYFDEARMIKVAGNRYQLVDAAGYTLLGIDDVQYIDYLVLQDYSKIIIRNRKTSVDDTEDAKEKYEYLEFDIDSFAGSTDAATTLTNVQYILKADPDSRTRANLVFMYAEAEDFEFQSKTVENEWRILTTCTPGLDEEEYYRNYYDVINPLTGEKTSNVPGSKAYSKANSVNTPFATVSGQIVEMTADGKVNEEKTSYDVIDIETNKNFAFITYVAEKDNTIEILPVNAEDASYFQREVYQLEDDTPIVLVKYDKTGDIYNAEVSKLTIADLAAEKKDIKCYNDKILEDGDDEYTTKYSEFVKCYIEYEEADDEDELPAVEYIVVVVHPDEQESFLED